MRGIKEANLVHIRRHSNPVADWLANHATTLGKGVMIQTGGHPHIRWLTLEQALKVFYFQILVNVMFLCLYT